MKMKFAGRHSTLIYPGTSTLIKAEKCDLMKCEICGDFYGVMRQHLAYLMAGYVVCVDIYPHV